MLTNALYVQRKLGVLKVISCTYTRVLTDFFYVCQKKRHEKGWYRLLQHASFAPTQSCSLSLSLSLSLPPFCFHFPSLSLSLSLSLSMSLSLSATHALCYNPITTHTCCARSCFTRELRTNSVRCTASHCGQLPTTAGSDFIHGLSMHHTYIKKKKDRHKYMYVNIDV